MHRRQSVYNIVGGPLKWLGLKS